MANPNYVSEHVTGFIRRHRGPVIGTALAASTVAAGCINWESNTEEFIQGVLAVPIHAFDHRAPWESETYKPPARQQPGTFALDSYFGLFASQVHGEMKFSQEVFGIGTDSTETIREGVVVNRLRMPGVAWLDTITDNNVMYITRKQNGSDVGIPLNMITFEMLNPEMAEKVNDELLCEHEISDPEYTGCIEADTFRSGVLADFPIVGSDQEGVAYLAGEMLFDQYSMIDRCYFDKVFIPFFNEVYKANGVAKRIDGTNRYSDAMEIFLRYFMRAKLPNIAGQNIFFHFSGTWEPIQPLYQRINDRAQQLGIPYSLLPDADENTCMNHMDGVSPIAVLGDNDVTAKLKKIALGGLERVPPGYNLISGQFEVDRFPAAVLEGDLGTRVNDVLKGVVEQ